MSEIDEYKVDVPEGVSGVWKIKRFTVDEVSSFFTTLDSTFGSSRRVPAGTYTMLTRGGYTVMSDTPAEIRDHMGVINRAEGEILVAGLGLGMVARAMARKEAVTKVTVVELSEDVIALTGPWLKEQSPKIEIVQADIFAWKPPKGAQYEVAWFDIWDDICTDNLPSMKTLHRKFARVAAWKGSWGRTITEMYASRVKRQPRRSIWG